MTKPTLRHLRTIAERLELSRPVWQPYGRRSWRLVFPQQEIDGRIYPEHVRGEPTERYRCGLPFEFATPGEALRFKYESLLRLVQPAGRQVA